MSTVEKLYFQQSFLVWYVLRGRQSLADRPEPSLFHSFTV
jgi:hypothetical protein